VRVTSQPRAWRYSLAMGDYGGIGGAEHHGGVPVTGQGFSAAQGKSNELRGELAHRRRTPRRRWWQFWRRHDDPRQGTA
jgi:hypothetical protein